MTLGGAESAVVRDQHDDGLFSKFQIIERLQHSSHRSIHRLDHRCVDGVLLNESDLALAFLSPLRFEVEISALLAVFRGQIFTSDERRMHRVKAQHCQERLLLMLLDELDRLGGEPVGKVFSFGTIAEARIAVGGEVLLATVGASPGDTTSIDIVALVLGPEPLRSKMPLAGEEGRVTIRLEDLGDGQLFERKPIEIGRWQRWSFALPALGTGRSEVVGGREPCRMNPGLDADTSRAAHRASGIGTGVAHSLSGETIDGWSLVKTASCATEIGPAQIIDDDQQDRRGWISGRTHTGTARGERDQQ